MISGIGGIGRENPGGYFHPPRFPFPFTYGFGRTLHHALPTRPPKIAESRGEPGVLVHGPARYRHAAAAPKTKTPPLPPFPRSIKSQHTRPFSTPIRYTAWMCHFVGAVPARRQSCIANKTQIQFKWPTLHFQIWLNTTP